MFLPYPKNYGYIWESNVSGPGLGTAYLETHLAPLDMYVALCLMKCSGDMLQNLSQVLEIGTKTMSVFVFQSKDMENFKTILGNAYFIQHKNLISEERVN